MSIEIKISGHLGKNISMTETKDKKGDPVKVVSFSVASTKFKRETVNGQEQLVPAGTDWVNCSYWKKDADNLHKSLQSGMPVTVTGTVSRVGVYTSKDTGEILPSIDINCDDVCLRLNSPRIDAIRLAPPRGRDAAAEPGESADPSQAFGS